MITYRTPTALDIPVLVSLEKSIFAIQPWSKNQFKEEIGEIGHSRNYILAESDGEIVGWGGAMWIDAAKEVQILTLAVVPEFRRQGIARVLLRSLIAWGLEKAVTTITLEARVTNDEAIGLYESEGFTKIAQRRNYYGPGLDALVMRKEIA